MTQLPLLDALVRSRYLVMTVLAAVMYISVAARLEGTSDWTYFTFAADVLFGTPPPSFEPVPQYDSDGRGGLHLYAEHSFIQIGPPSLLLAQILQIGPKDGVYVAAALVQLLGLLCVWLVERTFRHLGDHVRMTVLLGGSMVTIAWGSLTYYTHLDDAITLTSLAAGLLALRHGNWCLAGALLGLGAASKPWGIVVIALVLAADSWQSRAQSLAAAALVVAAFWAPFVLADVGTLTVNVFNLPTAGRSPLAAFGLEGTYLGEWIRPVQFFVAIAVTLFAALRQQWVLIPLLGFATRLLLDPAAHQYYVAGAVIGAFIADVAAVRRRVPLLTGVVVMSWLAVPAIEKASNVAAVRASTYVVLLLAGLALLLRGRDDSPSPSPSQT